MSVLFVCVPGAIEQHHRGAVQGFRQGCLDCSWVQGISNIIRLADEFTSYLWMILQAGRPSSEVVARGAVGLGA